MLIYFDFCITFSGCLISGNVFGEAQPSIRFETALLFILL